MAKEDNDKLKEVEKLFNNYFEIKSILVEEKPTTFRTDSKLIEALEELYNHFKLINENGIYNNKKETYLKIAYNVYEGMAFLKLRLNSFISVNGEKLDYDNIIDTDNMEIVIASKEEIIEGVNFFKKSLNILEDWKSYIQIDNYETYKFRIYHNLEETYQIYDKDEYYNLMRSAMNEGDIVSACNLLVNYCVEDLFLVDIIIEQYSRVKELLNILLEKQLKDGVKSFKEECEPIFGKSGFNMYKGFSNLDKMAKLNPNRGKYELKESLFINTTLKLIDELCNNSYFEEALKVINEFLKKYTILASWDSRYEDCFNKKLKRCNESIKVKKSEVLPSEAMLSCILPEVLDIMDSRIKTFIGTSLTIMKYCNKFTDFTLDYSPAVISLFKALEQILYKISYDGYYNFIRDNIKNYDLNHACIDYSIFDRDTKKIKELENFDIGTGLNLLCLIVKKKKEDDDEPLKREIVKPKTGVLDYLKLNKIDSPYEKIMDFCKNVEDCRIYRNKTAHKDIVERSTAEEAKAIILDTVKLINKAYTYFPTILAKKE